MKLLFFFCASMLLLTAGCKTTAEQPIDESSTAQPMDGIEGTVKYINLEGGFYGIQGSDGESYFPINLAEELKEDGLPVVFKFKPRPDIVTITMWGKTVEITEIAKR